MSFWQTGFWPSGFWSAGFWIGTTVPEIPSIGAGGEVLVRPLNEYDDIEEEMLFIFTATR